MNKKECHLLYQKEIERQENPYKQWILENESNIDINKEEVTGISLKIIKMEEFTSSFDVSAFHEQIFLFISENGILAKNAKNIICSYFLNNPNADIIYADEDEIDQTTNIRRNPWFKPDFAIDSFLSNFYFGHIFAIRVDKYKDIIKPCGKDYMKSIYQFMLHVIERTEQIYHLPQILFHQYAANTENVLLGVDQTYDNIKIEACQKRKMQVFLAKTLDIDADNIKNEGCKSNDREKDEIRHICYKIIGEPKVSVIIPSKDHYEIIKTCIQSFRKYTKYSNLEFIIVDNGSCKEQKDEITSFLRQEAKKGNIFEYQYVYEEMAFNFSKMCNLGARRASGEYLLFLNDDIECVCYGWFERMLGMAMQQHIGAVGAKLLYPDEKRIQHVGITSMGIGPAHKLNGFIDDRIYAHGENCLVLNKLAVTAACLMIEKKKFDEVQGFPEELAVAYNDVALCYALVKEGYLNVVRNDIVLYHHESLSRGSDVSGEKKARLLQEKELLDRKYPEYVAKDPYYNINLVQNRKDVDYSCNYIFEYEKRISEITQVTEKQKKMYLKHKSRSKWIRKLLEQDILLMAIESVQGRKPVEENGKKIFFIDASDLTEKKILEIEGWSVLQNKNNECYQYKLLLQNEKGTIYACEAMSKLRPDVEAVFSQTSAKSIRLSGKTIRITCDIITGEKYRIGFVANSSCNPRKSYWAWSEEYELNIT